jgi:CRISPR-associated endonuclease Csy4
MKYYIGITLLPDAEIGLGFLWKKVFTQVHLALAERGGGSIGVSFPKYGDKVFPMGDALRLFAGNEEALEALKIDEWMTRLRDYVTISGIQKTPDTIQEYVLFSRKQVKTGKERQARRYAKRHQVDYEEALKHYDNMEEKILNLPFVMLQSLSSNQEMKLFVEKRRSTTEKIGDFNSYGLSKEATVPWF